MTKSNGSGPGPLVWILTLAAIAAIGFLGWRSNQRPAASVPASAPAPAPQKTEPPPPPPAPPRTETNGGLAG